VRSSICGGRAGKGAAVYLIIEATDQIDCTAIDCREGTRRRSHDGMAKYESFCKAA
jgi:hypothetical protein